MHPFDITFRMLVGEGEEELGEVEEEEEEEDE